MNIVDRIRKVIEYKGISERKFTKEIGVANGFLSKVSDVGSSKLMKILNVYPEINPTWLLTGEGNMILDDDTDLRNESPKTAKDYIDFYENFVKVQRVVYILDKDRFSELYKDVSFRCNMIHEYIEHYSLFNKSQELTDETDKKELTKKVQQILNTEKELLKIMAPYSDMIYDMYSKLSDFDEKHERTFYLDEETEKRIEDALKDIPKNE
jgi:hypothetical protein